MPDFHPPLSSYIDGTWSELWKSSQTLPPHLIDGKSELFRCTCGYAPLSMDDWSDHVGESLRASAAEAVQQHGATTDEVVGSAGVICTADS